METTYRVLFTNDGEDLFNGPMIYGQEFCGHEYSQDDQYCEVYEFVTRDPIAMEQALALDPAVAQWSKRVGGLTI